MRSADDDEPYEGDLWDTEEQDLQTRGWDQVPPWREGKPAPAWSGKGLGGIPPAPAEPPPGGYADQSALFSVVSKAPVPKAPVPTKSKQQRMREADARIQARKAEAATEERVRDGLERWGTRRPPPGSTAPRSESSSRGPKAPQVADD